MTDPPPKHAKVAAAFCHYNESTLSTSARIPRATTIRQLLEEVDQSLAVKFKLNEKGWLKAEDVLDCTALDTKGRVVRRITEFDTSLGAVFSDEVKTGILRINVREESTPLQNALCTTPKFPIFTRTTPPSAGDDGINIIANYREDLFIGEAAIRPKDVASSDIESWDTLRMRELVANHISGMKKVLPFELPGLNATNMVVSTPIITKLPGVKPHYTYEVQVSPGRQGGMKKAPNPIRSGRSEWVHNVHNQEIKSMSRRSIVSEQSENAPDGTEQKVEHDEKGTPAHGRSPSAANTTSATQSPPEVAQGLVEKDLPSSPAESSEEEPAVTEEEEEDEEEDDDDDDKEDEKEEDYEDEEYEEDYEEYEDEEEDDYEEYDDPVRPGGYEIVRRKRGSRHVLKRARKTQRAAYRSKTAYGSQIRHLTGFKLPPPTITARRIVDIMAAKLQDLNESLVKDAIESGNQKADEYEAAARKRDQFFMDMVAERDQKFWDLQQQMICMMDRIETIEDDYDYLLETYDPLHNRRLLDIASNVIARDVGAGSYNDLRKRYKLTTRKKALQFLKKHYRARLKDYALGDLPLVGLNLEELLEFVLQSNAVRKEGNTVAHGGTKEQIKASIESLADEEGPTKAKLQSIFDLVVAAGVFS
ncbi:hypothetical protein BJ508DRAFT_366759 [Ascobolus immersus RN42]|uniref:Uncharacterized protein n=1 Tax=Ascobolus immersus RN42 TaxID=1160509 RepID=A0A3N4HH83_ASCIM|nr:hypothetical protein BJ508DRAFT_366759 [Ascobolus immersus RN42]